MQGAEVLVSLWGCVTHSAFVAWPSRPCVWHRRPADACAGRPCDAQATGETPVPRGPAGHVTHPFDCYAPRFFGMKATGLIHFPEAPASASKTKETTMCQQSRTAAAAAIRLLAILASLVFL